MRFFCFIAVFFYALGVLGQEYTTRVEGVVPLEEEVVVEGEHPGALLDGVALKPGVQLQRAGGVGQRALLSVRGMDASGTLVLWEGIGLNSRLFGGADVGSLDLLPLQVMTLEAGGRSGRLGSAAVGGVLRSWVKNPFGEPGLQVFLGMGSFGTARFQGAAGFRSPRRALVVGLGIQSSAGDFVYRHRGESRVRTNNGAVGLDGVVKFEEALGSHVRLEALGEYMWQGRDVAGLAQFPSHSARQRDRRVLASLKINGEWGGMGLEGHGFLRHEGYVYRDPLPPMGPAVFSSMDVVGGGVSVQGHWQMPAALGAVGGLEVMGDRALMALVHCHQWGMGVFGGVQWEPSHGFVEGVLRVQKDVPGQWQWLPQLQVQWQVQSWLRLSAQGSRSFRSPSLLERYFSGGWVQGNPNLQAERAWTADGGIRVTPCSGLSIDAGIYVVRPDNLIVFLPRSAFLTRAENTGKALLWGSEAQVQWKGEAVQLSGSYTLQKTSHVDGMPLPSRPQHKGGVMGAWTWGMIQVHSKVHVQSGFFLDRFAALRQKGRVLWDTGVGFRPMDKLALHVDVVNLLDVQDAVDFLQTPIAGRAIFVGVRAGDVL